MIELIAHASLDEIPVQLCVVSAMYKKTDHQICAKIYSPHQNISVWMNVKFEDYIREGDIILHCSSRDFLAAENSKVCQLQVEFVESSDISPIDQLTLMLKPVSIIKHRSSLSTFDKWSTDLRHFSQKARTLIATHFRALCNNFVVCKNAHLFVPFLDSVVVSYH